MKHGIDFLPLLFLILSIEITMVAAQANQAESDPGIGNEYPRTKFSRSMAMIIAITGGALLFVGLISVSIHYCYKRVRRAATNGGLHPSVIESLPTFSYSQVKDHKIGKDNLECAVCLNEFEDQQTLRMIPMCSHVFHPECIVAWLESHVTCPVCRANLDPQADVVPESSNVGRTSLNSRFEY